MGKPVLRTSDRSSTHIPRHHTTTPGAAYACTTIPLPLKCCIRRGGTNLAEDGCYRQRICRGQQRIGGSRHYHSKRVCFRLTVHESRSSFTWQMSTWYVFLPAWHPLCRSVCARR